MKYDVASGDDLAADLPSTRVRSLSLLFSSPVLGDMRLPSA